MNCQLQLRQNRSDGDVVTTAAKLYAAAIAGGVGWTWAVTLLASRQYLTGNYYVLSPCPHLWGGIGLPVPLLFLLLGAGACMAVASGHAVRPTGRFWAVPIRWWMCSWLIPVLDLLRIEGVSIPMTFLEPLLLAAITGAAAGATADAVLAAAQRTRLRSVEGDSPIFAGAKIGTVPRLPFAIPWRAVVWLLVVLCGGWWYYQGQQTYDNYLLGYNDFGHFGWRVANTWAGRGFLLETPSLPAFWDHFNPGLALLTPLWGLWPDARLFLLIQAVCLAAPALAVDGIARRLGATSAAAAVWSAAYLAFPALGQLNLNYTYGWHPVSVALPLIFVAVWALLQGRRTLAIVAAVLACSFQEDVIAVLCCLASAFAFQAWLGRRRFGATARGGRGTEEVVGNTSAACQPLSRQPPPSPSAALGKRGQVQSDGTARRVLRTNWTCPLFPTPADALPAWAWGVVAAVLAFSFVVVFNLTGLSKFQSSRFPELGSSAHEILLSPILRPTAFWGEILRPRCGYFLLCLAIPLGVRALARGWATLLATIVPFGVLLVWSHPPATSIAFQYTTVLIPILFLATMLGGVRSEPAPPAARDTAGGDPCRSLFRAGVVSLAASMTASVAFGSLPWSGPTLSDVVMMTYANPSTAEDRAVGSPGNAVLNQIVAKVGRSDSAVLATGRVASHLLAVRRLDTVGQACSRWKAFQTEVGPGRSPIELFDWVVLDTKEHFYQSPNEIRFVTNAAETAKYRLVQSEDGIVVYAKRSIADQKQASSRQL